MEVAQGLDLLRLERGLDLVSRVLLALRLQRAQVQKQAVAHQLAPLVAH